MLGDLGCSTYINATLSSNVDFEPRQICDRLDTKGHCMGMSMSSVPSRKHLLPRFEDVVTCKHPSSMACVIHIFRVKAFHVVPWMESDVVDVSRMESMDVNYPRIESVDL